MADSNQYAIIKTGGKQVIVEPGKHVWIEKIQGEVGSKVTLGDVMFINSEDSHIGTPIIDKASVTATITQQDRGPRVIAFRKRRRKGFTKKIGHRQYLTQLLVESINL